MVDQNCLAIHSAAGATARLQIDAVSDRRTANGAINRQLPSRCSKNHSRFNGCRVTQSRRYESTTERAGSITSHARLSRAGVSTCRTPTPLRGQKGDRQKYNRLRLPAGSNAQLAALVKECGTRRQLRASPQGASPITGFKSSGMPSATNVAVSKSKGAAHSFKSFENSNGCNVPMFSKNPLSLGKQEAFCRPCSNTAGHTRTSGTCHLD